MSARRATVINGEAIRREDVVEFAYAGGSAPGALRRVRVAELYDDGSIGGEESLVADGGYRKFLPGKISCLEVVQSVTEVEVSKAELESAVRKAMIDIFEETVEILRDRS